MNYKKLLIVVLAISMVGVQAANQGDVTQPLSLAAGGQAQQNSKINYFPWLLGGIAFPIKVTAKQVLFGKRLESEKAVVKALPFVSIASLASGYQLNRLADKLAKDTSNNNSNNLENIKTANRVVGVANLAAAAICFYNASYGSGTACLGTCAISCFTEASLSKPRTIN